MVDLSPVQKIFIERPDVVEIEVVKNTKFNILIQTFVD